MTAGTVRFAVIGINHSHIHLQIRTLLDAQAQWVSFYAAEDDLAEAFAKRYPGPERAGSIQEILEDESIHLITSAAVPSERTPLAIRAMRHGKDFMSDKPAAIGMRQLEDLQKTQQETKRIHSIFYSERLANPAAVKAGELIRAGAIGRVVQTMGTGPHHLRIHSRPDWFFDKARYGGILTDIGSHQMDQFLFYTGSTRAEIVAAQVGNFHHPEHPGLEDFGDFMIRGDRGVGYGRVDWYNPDGLASWGDCRMLILGTDGYMELRGNIDIAGREGGNHLFLVDQKTTRYINCSDVATTYGGHLIHDILHRTDTLDQKRGFLAMALAIQAQEKAGRLGNLATPPPRAPAS